MQRKDMLAIKLSVLFSFSQKSKADHRKSVFSGKEAVAAP
uniref:Uncharacterized protein n=1 Tax=Arundo donax TaxID=35708 RepID=A0A0A9FBD5_ARUDO